MSSPKLSHADWWNRIQKRMNALGLKQTDLAPLAGVTQPTVSRWRNGAWPKAQQLYGLSKALQISIDELMATSAAPAQGRSQDQRAREGWSGPRPGATEQPHPKRKRGRG